MMRRILSGFLLTPLLFLAAGCDVFGPPAPQFEVRLTGTRSEGDSIKVARRDDVVVFFVSSESGIGRAVIRPTEENWPERIAFQFDLGGLESFEIKGQQIYRTERHDDGAKDGYRIKVPSGVTGSYRDPIEVSWIDFYRN